MKKRNYKIGLFYEKLVDFNKELYRYLKKEGASVSLLNINTYVLSLDNLKRFKHDLYVNRVCDPQAQAYIRFMLEISKYIEYLNIPIINPAYSTYVDCSKTEAHEVLKEHGIPIPKSLLVSSAIGCLEAAKELGFPLVMKVDDGSRARDVHKITSLSHLKRTVPKLIREKHLVHLEEFIEPPGFITRTTYVGGKLLDVYQKRIVKGSWLASVSKGSSFSAYPDVSKKVIKMGERVARCTHSDILSLDIIEHAKRGPFVIDVNTTPQFTPLHKKVLGVDPAKHIGDYLLSLCAKRRSKK